jgi:hypothetical protein
MVMRGFFLRRTLELSDGARKPEHSAETPRGEQLPKNFIPLEKNNIFFIMSGYNKFSNEGMSSKECREWEEQKAEAAREAERREKEREEQEKRAEEANREREERKREEEEARKRAERGN